MSESLLRAELRRLVDLLDGPCTLPDGTNADTTVAHALLGDFRRHRADPACMLCGGWVDDLDRASNNVVVGQASGPDGVILHDDEVAHRTCYLRAAS